MNKKLIVIDDEPNVRLGYRLTLEAEGYGVSEATNVAEALESFATGSYDMALLDMRMPDMDGLALLTEMRRRNIQTPTVIITAYGDVPHAVQAMKLGAIDFLQKPLTPEALRNIVKDVLARHADSAFTATPPRDDFYTHLFTAKKLLNLQDFSGAKEHLIRALELNPESAEGYNLAGVLFEMQEDYTRAKRYYGQAIKTDKDFEPAQQNMRRIYELFHFGFSDEPYNLGNH
jgi:DNA-binding response OmpR family regulator